MNTQYRQAKTSNGATAIAAKNSMNTADGVCRIDGATVRATGNLTIAGTIEDGAEVESGGDICVGLGL